MARFISIEAREEFIMNSFQKHKKWEDKYSNIILWGRKMKPLHDSLKEDRILVQGCQSKVWLLAQKKDQRLFLSGDSDALITKGLLALMIYFYSDLTFKEVLKHPPKFIEKLDLTNHLTPTRAGGLQALIRQIKNYAKAFLIIETA